jgi:hypothetical protein
VNGKSYLLQNAKDIRDGFDELLPPNLRAVRNFDQFDTDQHMFVDDFEPSAQNRLDFEFRADLLDGERAILEAEHCMSAENFEQRI